MTGTVLQPVDAPPSVPDRPRRLRPADLLFVVAWVFWIIGVATIHLGNAQGTWGLVAALPWTFFVGLLVLVLSFTVQLAEAETSNLRLGAHMVSLVFMIQAVMPLVYPEARFFWQYHEVGETDLVALHGHLIRSVDVYQRWPGFFGLTAWLDKVAGLASPLSYIAWAQVFFDLLFTLGLGFAIQALPLTTREKWAALFLFFTGNWVAAAGQDLFTPQALAFFLALVIFGIALRWMPHRVRPADERASEIGTGSLVPPLVVLFAIFAVVIVMHPLTPFILIIQLGALLVLNRLRPLWVVPVMGLMTVAYFLPDLSYLQQTHQVLSGVGNVSHNASASGPSGTRRVGPNRYFILLLSGSIAVLAAAGILRRMRHHRPFLNLLLLAGAPILLVLAVSYGNESSYRAYFFGLPWAACLAASALFPTAQAPGRAPAAPAEVGADQAPRSVAPSGTRWRHRALWMAGVTALLAVITVSSVIINYSQNEIYEVAPGDVQAATYFYTHAPPGVAIYLNGNFPIDVGARYNLFQGGRGNRRYSAVLIQHADSHDIGNEVDDITTYACSIEPRHQTAYLLLSKDETKYGDDFGLLTPDSVPDLLKHISHDPDWKVYYRNGTTVIYRDVADCHPYRTPEQRARRAKEKSDVLAWDRAAKQAADRQWAAALTWDRAAKAAAVLQWDRAAKAAADRQSATG